MPNLGKCTVGALCALWMTSLAAEEQPINIAPGTTSISLASHEGPITLERFANGGMLTWTSLGLTARENTHLDLD